MKCVQSLADGKVKRVHATKAHDMVRSGNWKYAPKSVFKGSTDNWVISKKEDKKHE